MQQDTLATFFLSQGPDSHPSIPLSCMPRLTRGFPWDWELSCSRWNLVGEFSSANLHHPLNPGHLGLDVENVGPPPDFSPFSFPSCVHLRHSQALAVITHMLQARGHLHHFALLQCPAAQVRFSSWEYAVMIGLEVSSITWPRLEDTRTFLRDWQGPARLLGEKSYYRILLPVVWGLEGRGARQGPLVLCSDGLEGIRGEKVPCAACNNRC